MTPEKKDAMWNGIAGRLPRRFVVSRRASPRLHPIESTDVAFDVFGCPTYEELTRRRRLVNRARYTLFAVLLAALGVVGWGWWS